MTSFPGFYAETYRQLRAEGLQADMAEIEARQAAMPAGESHWEFAAIALLHHATQNGTLDERARAWLCHWETQFNPQHPAGNWRLMRAIVQDALKGQALGYAALVKALGPLGGDGHLPDVQGEVSSQYHAYNLLLLARFGDATIPEVADAVRRGFAWLLEVDKAYGDPSPLGRGKFQTFGYAAMQASANYASRYGIQIDTGWVARVASRLAGVAPGMGAIPPFWDGPYRQHLLHGYNTIDDYPAFAEFWEAESPVEAAPPEPGMKFVLREEYGTLVYTNNLGPVLYVPSEQPRRPGILSRVLTRVGLRRTAASAKPVPARGTWVGDLKTSGAIAQCVWYKPASDNAAAGQMLKVMGSAEQASLTWTGPANARWAGQDVRMVRRGSVSIELG